MTRLARSAAIWLVLGFIASAILSAVLALEPLRALPRPMRLATKGWVAPGDPRVISLSRRDAWGRTWVAVTASPHVPTGTSEQFVDFNLACPAWARADLVPWERDPAIDAHARAVVATGWPFRALYSTFEQQPSGGYWCFKARDGIVVRAAPPAPDFRSPLSPRDRTLPTRVRSLALIGDALFWGVALAGLRHATTRTPRAIRRWNRRRRNRCVRCGYPRAGLAPGSECPECGHEPASG